MTVYELIQELSNYNADTEVRFKVNAEFDTYVESLFDTKHGARFECICDCGNKTIQRGYDLRKGNVVSC